MEMVLMVKDDFTGVKNIDAVLEILQYFPNPDELFWSRDPHDLSVTIALHIAEGNYQTVESLGDAFNLEEPDDYDTL